MNMHIVYGQVQCNIRMVKQIYAGKCPNRRRPSRLTCTALHQRIRKTSSVLSKHTKTDRYAGTKARKNKKFYIETFFRIFCCAMSVYVRNMRLIIYIMCIILTKYVNIFNDESNFYFSYKRTQKLVFI